MDPMNEKLLQKMKLLQNRVTNPAFDGRETTASDENSANDQIAAWQKLNSGNSFPAPDPALTSPETVTAPRMNAPRTGENSEKRKQMAAQLDTSSATKLARCDFNSTDNVAKSPAKQIQQQIVREESTSRDAVMRPSGSESSAQGLGLSSVSRDASSKAGSGTITLPEAGHSRSQSMSSRHFASGDREVIQGGGNSRGATGDRERDKDKDKDKDKVIAGGGVAHAGGSKTAPISRYFMSASTGGGGGNATLSHSISASSTAHLASDGTEGAASSSACIIDISGSRSSQYNASSSSSSSSSSSATTVSVGINTISTPNTGDKLTVVMLNDLKRQVDQLKQVKDLAESKSSRLELELRNNVDNYKQLEEKNINLITTLQGVYKSAAIQEARRKREVIAAECVRLGRIVTIRSPGKQWGDAAVVDVWEEGYATKDLRARESQLFKRKQELENRKKALTSLQRANARSSNKVKNSASSDDMTTPYNDPISSVSSMDLDIATEYEALKYHSDQIKQEEHTMAEERKLLDADKASHQKELKRIRNEDESIYMRDLKCLKGGRYQLQHLLGKGGFSEVWKAMDLYDLKEVAVKIHKLNAQWPEEKKTNYVKHVTREYQIHKDMIHPRIVQLYDVFEIDENSFATVLEHCKGIDLDEKLKRSRNIPEKDAKSIVMQIISGLRYLNTPQIDEPAGGGSGGTFGNDATGDAAGAVLLSTGNTSSSTQLVPNPNSPPRPGANGAGASAGELMPPPAATLRSSGTTANGAGNNGRAGGAVVRRKAIIHYDLKPANILFDDFGDVKITDFGLSKVIDDSTSDGDSVELTSMGAGTYWYLPPECFMGISGGPAGSGNLAPRISSKVDVWSVGVIFYQMLYGRRPFGEGKSQEVILREGTILSANKVDFPTPTTGNTSGLGASHGHHQVPKVSEEAKDFIRTCLAHDQAHRPDVHALCQHPYLIKRR